MQPTNRNVAAIALAAAALSLTSCQTTPGGGAERSGKKATFAMENTFTINVPPGTNRLRAWLARPQEDDPAQKVKRFRVASPYPTTEVRDNHGNTFLYLEAENPPEGVFTVTETFRLTRREALTDVDPNRSRPYTAEERERFSAYLQPSTYVVIDDRVRALASEIVGAEDNPVVAAHEIYKWTLENIDYWVKDPANKKASPVGSTVYCLDTGTGNCTDFHSLWTSLARAAGIPTQMVYGSLAKPELEGADADQSYHCWPEFYAPEIGWIPHDVAVADIYYDDFPLGEHNARSVELTTATGYRGKDFEMVKYYFGNLDERRVTWSRGRDLMMENQQDTEPVNALPKAHVEVDGRPHPEKTGWTRRLTYREI